MIVFLFLNELSPIDETPFGMETMLEAPVYCFKLLPTTTKSKSFKTVTWHLTLIPLTVSARTLEIPTLSAVTVPAVMEMLDLDVVQVILLLAFDGSTFASRV